MSAREFAAALLAVMGILFLGQSISYTLMFLSKDPIGSGQLFDRPYWVQVVIRARGSLPLVQLWFCFGTGSPPCCFPNHRSRGPLSVSRTSSPPCSRFLALASS